MTETIETFVSRLHQEGVQAGHAEAEKIQAQARRQADQIIQDARQQAQQILTQAQAQAASSLEKGKTELQLAARDTILTLRSKIIQILQTVLRGAVKPALEDGEFLRSLLRDIVMQYAQADSEKGRQIKINLTQDQYKKLADWAIEKAHQAVQEMGMSLDLKGTLRQPGFEYQVGDATVEVTVESTVQMLMQFVSPALTDLLEQAEKNIPS